MSGFGTAAQSAGLKTVAVVDPHPADYTALLAAELPGVQWRWLATGSQALRLARHEAVSLWIFNTVLDDMSGLDLCAMVKALLPDSAVYLVADEYSAQEELAAWANGASFFACKPARSEWLDSRIVSPTPAGNDIN
jgi:DNA-binding response OmpR family regulator